MLTDQEKAKIRQEAETLYPVLMQSMVDEPLWDINKQYRDVWIEAVTAERERAKVLVDALEEIRDEYALGSAIYEFVNMAKDLSESSLKKYNQ